MVVPGVESMGVGRGKKDEWKTELGAICPCLKTCIIIVQAKGRHLRSVVSIIWNFSQWTPLQATFAGVVVVVVDGTGL